MRKKIIIYCGVTLLVAIMGFASGYFFETGLDYFNDQGQVTDNQRASAKASKESKPLETVAGEASNKLVTADFKIGDISLGTAKQQVYRTLGNPLRTAVLHDASQNKKVTVLYYQGIEISLNEQEAVAAITGTAREFTGPHNISVGMSRENVLEKLGSPQAEEKDVMVYSSEADEGYKLFVITNNQTVISLSISRNN